MRREILAVALLRAGFLVPGQIRIAPRAGIPFAFGVSKSHGCCWEQTVRKSD